MADSLVRSQEGAEPGRRLKVGQCLQICGVSSSGYYDWKRRREKETERQRRRREQDELIMERLETIVRRLGYVPGKRGFKAHLFREFDDNVGLRRISRLMKRAGLVANRPKKDAYKGQARHDHRCDAPADLVGRGFQVGPRQVVLTDITYLYYGKARRPFYLCVFKDPFTREALGAAASTSMDVSLVTDAYNDMMGRHGQELSESTTSVYIHSDQGSQYLSTTFRELLEDDGFVQSCSRRGNSLDNSPMESFFGRMKCRILDLVALCPDARTAIRMALGYVDSYNNEMYQLELAGLTPSEYHSYVTTGIYPCDTYFGVKATELMSVSELVEERLKRQRERSEKARLQAAARRLKAERLPKTAPETVRHDIKLLEKEKARWHESMVQAKVQEKHIDHVIKRAHEAEEFLARATPELLEELRDPQRWREHPELAYVRDMRELF